MLGERTGYFTGALADTKKGKRMSPGTSANFRSTEVPWYLKKMDESDITYGQTGSEHPEELIKKEIKKKVKKRQDIAEEALLAEQESKQNKIFKDVEKYKHLAKNKILVHVQENFRSKPISKQLLDKIVDLTLEYPDIKIFNKYGSVDEDKLKQVIDQAVMDAKIHPVDGLTLTQSITPEGAPSGIGLSYEGDNVTLDYPDVSKGDYSVGFNYNLKDNPLLNAKIPQGVRNPGGDLTQGLMSKKGDLKFLSELGVEDDILTSRKHGFDYGDGILSASQTTFPGEKTKINEAALNKKFNLTDNIGLNVHGNVKNVQEDGSTVFRDKSLTPGLTYKQDVGGGTLDAILSKEIMKGGDAPNLGIGYEYPIDQKSWLTAEGPQTSDKGILKFQGSDLLSEDRSGTLGYYKNILGEGDNSLNISTEVNPFNLD